MRGPALSLALLGFAFACHATTNEVAVAKSTVVLVRDASAVQGFDADPVRVRAMVSVGIKTLAGRSDELSAWRQFVSSNDVVGIKIDTLGGPIQATRREVVEAIAHGLHAAGVPSSNVYVWDRDSGRMRAAGYLKVGWRGLWREVSVVGDTGWDEKETYEGPLVGALIWGDLLFGKEEVGISTVSHLPKILTRTITKLINVPVLHDHDACGIAGCLYNVSLGAVDNARRFEIEGQHGDPSIAEICALPAVRGKLVLNVMDALIGGYAGGPAFKPKYSWRPGALYFSRDPVAVDSVCLQLLEAKRREAKIPAIGSIAGHIATAARLGLGQSDTNNVELIEAKP
jgi:uncharacterized protein (DUF362 family)